MSHRDLPIKKNRELSKPMDLMNVGFVGTAGGVKTLQNAPIWGVNNDQTIETFSTYPSGNIGSWTSSGNTNLGVKPDNDNIRCNKSTSGQYINIQFSIPANTIPNDSNFTLRFKHSGSHTYSPTGSNPNDASYQLYVQDSSANNRIGFIWEHVPHQGGGVGGVLASVKSSGGNTGRSVVNATPTSGDFYFEIDKQGSVFTLKMYPNNSYSGTPTYSHTINNTHVSGLTGLDRIVITDNSWNSEGAWTTTFDDFELIVLM